MPAPTCSPTTSSASGACQPPNVETALGVLVRSAGRLRDPVEGREQVDLDDSHGASLSVEVMSYPLYERESPVSTSDVPQVTVSSVTSFRSASPWA